MLLSLFSRDCVVTSECVLVFLGSCVSVQQHLFPGNPEGNQT